MLKFFQYILKLLLSPFLIININYKLLSFKNVHYFAKFQLGYYSSIKAEINALLKENSVNFIKVNISGILQCENSENSGIATRFNMLKEMFPQFFNGEHKQTNFNHLLSAGTLCAIDMKPLINVDYLLGKNGQDNFNKMITFGRWTTYLINTLNILKRHNCVILAEENMQINFNKLIKLVNTITKFEEIIWLGIINNMAITTSLFKGVYAQHNFEAVIKTILSNPDIDIDRKGYGVELKNPINILCVIVNDFKDTNIFNGEHAQANFDKLIKSESNLRKLYSCIFMDKRSTFIKQQKYFELTGKDPQAYFDEIISSTDPLALTTPVIHSIEAKKPSSMPQKEDLPSAAGVKTITFSTQHTGRS